MVLVRLLLKRSNEKYPHVLCFICPTHSIDHVLGDFLSPKELITIRGQGSFEVDTSFFTEVWDAVWDLVKFVANHQFTLALYRVLVKEQDPAPPDGTELLRYADTRYGSKVKVVRRVENVHPTLERLFTDARYTAWLNRQKASIKAAGAATKSTVYSVVMFGDGNEQRGRVRITTSVLIPIYRAMRLSDGKKGGSLGKLYRYLLDVDQLLAGDIPGLPDDLRDGLSSLFHARWCYFHTPLHTAAFMIEIEYCAIDFALEDQQAGEDAHYMKDLHLVFMQVATEEHSFPELVADYATFADYVRTETHNFSKKAAFHESQHKLANHQWWQTWGTAAGLTHLTWFGSRTGSCATSASFAEGNWSVRDWIHSKKRNLLGTKTVECLLRANCNMKLEQQWEDFDYAVLPWDIEMVLAEPEAPQPDGRSAADVAADQAALAELVPRLDDYHNAVDEQQANEQQGRNKRVRTLPPRLREYAL